MKGDRERWDEKYRGRLGRERKEPDPFFLRCLDRLGEARGRTALDLASGAGRHAHELARRGYRTSAWDVSPVGLGLLEREARAGGLEVVVREVDVVEVAVGFQAEFDLVCVVDFLDRPLWRRLHELVPPGGHVIARTFTRDWPGARPPIVYRLDPGELSRGLEGLETLDHEEAEGRAGLLARRS